MGVKVLPYVNPGRSGSSGIGSVLGAIGGALGVIAAPVTGGASLAGTAAAIGGGAATGAGIGGMLGGAIDPGKAAKESPQVDMEDKGPISRRLAAADQNSKLMQLRESAMALPQIPEAQRAEYAPQILEAYSRTRRG